MAKVEFAVPLTWYSNPGGEQAVGRREKKEENLIAVCLAGCASYFNSLLHTNTTGYVPYMSICLCQRWYHCYSVYSGGVPHGSPQHSLQGLLIHVLFLAPSPK
jgi:hypothetical protein